MPTTADLPRVSVVVATRGRKEAAATCARAALANPEASEVVVVVDGCRDGTFELLDSISGDDPRLRPVFVEHTGRVDARWRGVEVATGDVVLFLDDDVVATTRLARGHAIHHAAAPRRVVVGYMPVSSWSRHRQATARIYAGDYEHACSGYERASEAVLLDMWGGNVSIRRDDCLAIGFDREHPSAQHEDLSFGIRCHRAGLRGVFDRGLLAEHRYERDRRRFLRIAAEQVPAMRAIHDRFPELVGPWDPASYGAFVPDPILTLLDAPVGPTVRRGELAMLELAERFAARVHARWVQDRALLLARAIVQRDATRAS